MKFRLCLLLVIVGVLMSPFLQVAAMAEEDSEKFTKDLEPELKKAIRKAIGDGVARLLSQQNADGSWNARPNLVGPNAHVEYLHGNTVLTLYTVLKCGTSPGHDKVKKAFDFLRDKEMNTTYERGILLMALHAKFHKSKIPVRGKKKKGSAVKSATCKSMPKDDKAWMEKLVKQLLDSHLKPSWRYPDHEASDNSNAQYALLGLAAAEDCGIKVPEDVWFTNLQHFLRTQNKSMVEVDHIVPEEGKSKKKKKKKKKKKGGSVVVDQKNGGTSAVKTPGYVRGWGYSQSGSPVPDAGAYGSMTAIGIASIIICKQKLIKLRSRKYNKRLDKEVKDAVEHGLTWLEHNFSVTTHPKHPQGQWLYYYLYSLERAGMLSNRVYLGERQWFKEGAEYLTTNSWPPYSDTCFALLFLKRASGDLRATVSSRR